MFIKERKRPNAVREPSPKVGSFVHFSRVGAPKGLTEILRLTKILTQFHTQTKVHSHLGADTAVHSVQAYFIERKPWAATINTLANALYKATLPARNARPAAPARCPRSPAPDPGAPGSRGSC